MKFIFIKEDFDHEVRCYGGSNSAEKLELLMIIIPVYSDEEFSSEESEKLIKRDELVVGISKDRSVPSSSSTVERFRLYEPERFPKACPEILIFFNQLDRCFKSESQSFWRHQNFRVANSEDLVNVIKLKNLLNLK